MLVGDMNVGKTSIMKAFTEPNSQYYKVARNTIGLEYGERITILKGKRVKVQIWDTAGQ